MRAAPVIPDHALLRPIGQGAYGEVWLARNAMGTLRAVKIIWRRQFDSARPFERELAGIRRYEPVSRSSGGLVHVLHIGKNDAEGYFYYVMELADDASEAAGKDRASSTYEPRTLRADLKRLGRLPTSDCLRLAIEVASGLGQLHRNGLVHRDVKPGNIIFVNNRGKLADIGLVTTEGEGRTFVGTEGYIPPEGPGTPAADLYALGVVLYEASTGFSPDRLPDVPAEWLADPGGDEALELNEVILKACEGQRERRYANVESLQADLAVLQSGQSVRRVRALERRYRRLRQVGLVGTALLICAVVSAFFANYRARLAAESKAREIVLRQKAQESQARAETAEQQGRQQLYSALLEQARATVLSGELGQRVRALDAIRRAAAITNTAELRGAAMAAIALPDWRFERQWPKTADTTLIEFDPAFKRLALCRGRGPVEIRQASDRRLLATLTASTNLPAYVAHWSSDGQFLAVKRDWPGSDSLADLEVWKVAEQHRVLLAHGIKQDAIAFQPRLPWIMAALSHEATVWNLQNGEELRRFKLQEVPLLLAISPDGERFATGYEGANTSVVSIYRIGDGALLMSHSLEDTVSAIDWHPNGRWLATSDFSGAVQLLDTETGQARLLGRHKAQAVLAKFTPEGDYLLTAGWEREFIWWDVRRMQRAFTIGLDSYRAQLRADGGECAIVTDSEVELHAIEHPAGCREFSEEMGAHPLHAAFSHDGRWLAAAGSQGLVVWDLSRHDIGTTLQEGAYGRYLFFSHGELFASTDDHGYRWRVVPGSEPSTAPGLEPVAVFDPPGFASLCVVSNQVVLTAQGGSCALPLEQATTDQHRWSATVRGFSAGSLDGQWLAIFPSYSWVLNIYRMPNFESVATLTNPGNISGVEFSPLGDEVAVSTPRGVEIWSTSNWQAVRQLNFMGLVYSPDARTFWLTKDFRSAGLYDAKALELLLPLPLGVRPIAISDDGRLLAAIAGRQRLQVWDLFEVRQHLKDLGLDW